MSLDWKKVNAQLQKGSKKTEEKKSADVAAKPKTDAKPLVDTSKSQTTDQAQPAQDEGSVTTFPKLKVPPPKEIMSGEKGEEEQAEMVETEAAAVQLPGEHQKPSLQQPAAAAGEESAEDVNLLEELEQRVLNAVNKALEPVLAGINGLQDRIFVHTEMLTDLINSAKTDLQLSVGGALDSNKTDINDGMMAQAEIQIERADERISGLENRLNESAVKKGEEIAAEVKQSVGSVQEEVKKLQTKIDEILKKMGGLEEIRIETTKHGLVLVLELDNYKEALTEFMEKFDAETVKALLPVIAQDSEFVREVLVKEHYPAVGLEEFDRDSRRAEQRKWIDDTARIIVKRAQKCAEGDV